MEIIKLQLSASIFLLPARLIWDKLRNSLLVAVLLLLNLLDLLRSGPFPGRVHHAGHPRARHGAAAVTRWAHGGALRGHTAGWGHARSLQTKQKTDC